MNRELHLVNTLFVLAGELNILLISLELLRINLLVSASMKFVFHKQFMTDHLNLTIMRI